MTIPPDLAARAARLLPGLDLDGRLDLIAAMTPGEAQESLAWLAAAFPQMFDAAVVRDRTLPGRLQARIREQKRTEGDGRDDG